MRSKTKRCGSCWYYQKWTNNGKNSGLCEKLDSRTDSGNICEDWKSMKYKRDKKKE